VNTGAGGLGNGGAGANGGGDYEKLVAAKQAEGLTRIAAVAFVNKNHPKAWKAQAEKLRTAIASN